MGRASWILAGVLALTTPISAQTWDETINGGGDAGDLPATTQDVVGAGPLTSITGATGSTTDVDVYTIRIVTPATFSATTEGTPGTVGDTKLHLFQLTGIGIAFNDDDISARATLPAGNALYSGLPVGNYLLAVTSFDLDANSAGGKIFPDTFPGTFGPTGPGGGAALSSWTGAGAAGTYQVDLTGAEFVPNAPPTAVLTGGSSFTGTAAAGFDLTIAAGATLANANLNLTDADGDPIDVNLVVVTPSAIVGVTAPTAPQTNLASGTTISWTGTVAAATTAGVRTYAVTIDDDVNPNVVFNVRITVTVAGAGAGGGGGGGKVTTRGGDGASGFLPCVGGSVTPVGSSGWLVLAALMALHFARFVQQRARRQCGGRR